MDWTRLIEPAITISLFLFVWRNLGGKILHIEHRVDLLSLRVSRIEGLLEALVRFGPVDDDNSK